MSVIPAGGVMQHPVDDARLRVASVPAGHVYVRHLSCPDAADRVQRLPDPRPCPAPSDQSVWWPPAMLDPGWIRANHDRFDVFHIHFGFDAQTVENLRELVKALREHRKPLVYTVHDLRNPHHLNRAAHDAHLDVLIPSADDLITLTDGAAAAIRTRWNRGAHVIPHPHVVDFNTMRMPRQPRSDFVVGVHVKSVRANMDCLPLLRRLAHTVADMPGAILRVDAHTEVLDPTDRHHYRPDLVAWLQAAHRDGLVRLHVHDVFSDNQLWAYLRDEIDVSVLPYTFGTHSGWLEGCYDLGTIVIAPNCGFYSEQQRCFEYQLDENGLDERSLSSAVWLAYEQRPLWRATPESRMEQRRRIAASHRAIYRQVLR